MNIGNFNVIFIFSSFIINFKFRLYYSWKLNNQLKSVWNSQKTLFKSSPSVVHKKIIITCCRIRLFFHLKMYPYIVLDFVTAGKGCKSGSYPLQLPLFCLVHFREFLSTWPLSQGWFLPFNVKPNTSRTSHFVLFVIHLVYRSERLFCRCFICLLKLIFNIFIELLLIKHKHFKYKIWLM